MMRLSNEQLWQFHTKSKMELPLPYANSDGTSSIRVDIYRRNCACQFSIRQDSLSLSFTTSIPIEEKMMGVQK